MTVACVLITHLRAKVELRRRPDLEGTPAVIVDRSRGRPVVVDRLPAAAVPIGAALEDLGVFHFEEPRPAQDLEGLARIADALTIPIASGEMIYTHHQYRDLITRGRVDIIQPDIVKAPGFTEFLKIEALASAFGIPITVHNTQPVLSTVAHLHFCAASRMVPYSQEYNIEPISVRDDWPILKEPLEVVDGYIAVPDGPGLGVELDDEMVRRLAR